MNELLDASWHALFHLVDAAERATGQGPCAAVTTDRDKAAYLAASLAEAELVMDQLHKALGR